MTKQILKITCFLLLVFVNGYGQNFTAENLKGKRILVYTKNGKGYVHENIPYSIAALQKLGKELNFEVDTTTNPVYFTDENLKKYHALVFSNTNNDVFDTDDQKVALMRYIQAGGGFVGLHSAVGTERNWKWYKMMVGATFYWHPPLQIYKVHVLQPEHPSMKKLPLSWETKDECYFFKEMNPSINVLLVSDITSVEIPNDRTKPDIFGNRYPAAWSHNFDGGRVWYTSLGHQISDYSDPKYLLHVLEGIKWAVGDGKLDYKKAYSTTPQIDEWKYKVQ